MKILGVIAGSLMLSACAGTMQTHVQPAKGFSYELNDCSGRFEPAVCDAFNLSNRWIETYLHAGSNPSTVRNGIALAVLPASAVAAFYGLTGHGSSDRITRLTLGAATAYGMGTFVAGKGKQGVYFEGAHAMSCVQLGLVPTLIEKKEVSEVWDARIALDKALRQIDSLQLDLSAEGAQTVVFGRSMSETARRYVAFVDATPLRVRARVTAIAIEVNKLLLQNEPNLESLMSLAGSLDEIAGALRVAPLKPITSTSAHALDSPELNNASVMTALAEIHTQSQFIYARTVDLADRQSAVAAIDNCGVASGQAALKVSPSNSAMTVAAGASLEFVVEDSTGFPSADTNSDAIEVLPIVVRGSQLVLKVNGKKKTGVEGAVVSIHSASGKSIHTVTIVVTAPAVADNLAGGQGAGPTPVSSVGSGPAAPKNDLEKELFVDRENILKLQCVVGLKGVDVDCVLGEKTRAAIKVFNGGSSDELTGDLVDKLNKVAVVRHCDDPAKPACPN